ncbi:MAG: hypothetical protein RBU37_18750 [Myxococcota bacterium]|jgi:hypothetical protein|nr:hypothetical protein [Myxococcota bacterium]
MAEEQGFKRINFFKGFVTTTKDWNDAERYHVEKRKLHNRCFHGAGMVPGYRQELKVRARGRPDMSVEVSPGYAIDGQGSDIILWETEIKTINKGDYKLPTTIFVVAKFVEEFTDFIAYKENLDFKGHRRILERARIDVTITEPDIRNEVELARIFLTEDAKRITDAKDENDPGPNEIDLRYVPKAGVAGGYIQMDLLLRLRQALRQQRQFFTNLGRDKKVLSANAVALGLMTLDMLMETGAVGPQNIVPLMSNVGDLEWDVVTEIEASKPSIKAKKDFGQFKHSVEVFRGLLGEKPAMADESGAPKFDSLDQIISFQEKGGQSLGAIAGEPEVVVSDEGEVSFQIGSDWEKVKQMSGDLPETIMVDGVEWTLIDTIDMLDKASEEAHKFQILEARDSWRTRQRIRYPDGTIIEDTGIAHEGGFATFEIHNITPHRPLAILRRMDYVRGDFEIEYLVNEKRVGISQCPGSDRRFRWRNWPFVIAEEFVTAETLAVKQRALTADRDLNMFRFWFYQAL